KMHNALCNISAECSDTLFCTHGVCKCDRIDNWTGNNCTAKTTYGHSCLSNDDCTSQQICVNNTCICHITDLWNGTTCILAPKECSDINFKVDGVFTIYPTNALHPKPAYCVIQNGTRWTVIQRRFNGSVDFYRNWKVYKNGFGNVHGEHWLGNEFIHILSSNGRHKIRFQLWKTDGTNKHADYSTFSIGDEANKYLLTVNGYSGTAGCIEIMNDDQRCPSSNIVIFVKIPRLKSINSQLSESFSRVKCYRISDGGLFNITGISNTQYDSPEQNNDSRRLIYMYASNLSLQPRRLREGLISVGREGRASGKKFSTFDSDNDPVSRNCANEMHGGWWYSDCEYADLNQNYRSMRWLYDMGQVKKSIMMISRDK
ncbi:Hypothetical predicted protein, partial [Mytilus galloprovincialis]